MLVYTYTHTRIHACTHTDIQTTCIHACIHIHIHIHIYIHTHTYTNINTNTHVNICISLSLYIYIHVIRLLFLSLWSTKKGFVQEPCNPKKNHPGKTTKNQRFKRPTWAARYKESAGNIVDKEMHLMVRSTWEKYQTIPLMISKFTVKHPEINLTWKPWNKVRKGKGTSTNYQFLWFHVSLPGVLEELLLFGLLVSLFKQDFIIRL